VQPKVNMIAICDQVIQDVSSGKKSLIGLFDGLFAQNFPVQHPRFFIYTVISAAPGQKVLAALRLLGPTGLAGEVSYGEVQITSSGKHDLVTELIGQAFPAPGDYRVVVMLQDREAGEAKITVALPPQTTTGNVPSVH